VELYLHPPCVFMAWYIVKHRHQFTFILLVKDSGRFRKLLQISFCLNIRGLHCRPELFVVVTSFGTVNSLVIYFILSFNPLEK